MAKGLCVILIILHHSQMCCKRRLVKRRVRRVRIHSVRHGFVKKENLSKPQLATNSTESIAASQTKSKEAISKKIATKTFKKIDKISASEEAKKYLEATQEADFDSDRNKDDVVEAANVKWLGNLNRIVKDRKQKLDEEIEGMKSIHQMDDFKLLPAISDPKLHVKIAEKKCVLYETDDEPTADDELEDNIL